MEITIQPCHADHITTAIVWGDDAVDDGDNEKDDDDDDV